MTWKEHAMYARGSPVNDQMWPGGWPQTCQEFEAFQDTFLPRLVSSAFRRLGNLEEAEDIIQDVLVKAYADRKKLRRVQRVGPYLYRMVANACIQYRRRRRFLSLESLRIEDIADRGSEASQQLTATEEIMRIEHYLSRLPDNQAEVIRFRVLDQLSLSEIAEVTGCSLPTVKSRLHYALEKLRRIVPHTREGLL